MKMISLSSSVPTVGLSGMNKFDWCWNISDIKQDKDIKVFTTFSCGGGSSLGYKRAGFKVLGNVEIDPKINNLYIANNKPRYNFCEDLREFNKRDDLPEELYQLDILDGSPPCTSFSTAGVRERDWGKKKKFKEGQAYQTLDDLFFVFLETVGKLKPRVVIAENVVGIVKGKAKGYTNLILKRFKDLGYDVQVFSLNAAYMNVPQGRHRIFFIANRCGFPKLKLDFKEKPITFGEVRSQRGKDLKKDGGVLRSLIEKAGPNDMKLEDVAKRITGQGGKYYTAMIVHDEQVAPTITSGGNFFRYHDRLLLSDTDFRNIQSFPQDYDFKNSSVQYVCGMSVPPNMMANIAAEVFDQWLK